MCRRSPQRTVFALVPSTFLHPPSFSSLTVLSNYYYSFRILSRFSSSLFIPPSCPFFPLCYLSVSSSSSFVLLLAWENSRHLATPPLVSPPNGVWETSAESPYWWRVTTQIWVVLLIGRAAWEICFNQSEALPRISALVAS